MNGLPYYKAYPRDFIEGTIGMPFEIKCAYRVVLDLIYMQGGNLPDDARYISGLLGCSIRKWKSIRQFLVDAGKVEVSGDFLTNHRAEKELETLAKLQDKQRENRCRPNKNKGLQSPSFDQSEPEPDNTPKGVYAHPQKPDRRSPKKRIPDGWVPSKESAVRIIEDFNLTKEEMNHAFQAFTDDAHAHGRTYADWDRAFRNRIRSQVAEGRFGPGSRFRNSRVQGRDAAFD